MDAMRRLLGIMAALRDAQTGCPQPATNLRHDRAVHPRRGLRGGRRDPAWFLGELRDELGDLLFQIVFYSQIAREGHFDFEDVARGICDKMTRRHPHVFGDAEYHDDDAQLRSPGRRRRPRNALREEGAQSEPDGRCGEGCRR